MENKNQICSKCGLEKSLTEFKPIKKKTKYYYSRKCKMCKRENKLKYDRKYRLKNPNKRKECYQKNKKIENENSLKYYYEHKDIINKKRKESGYIKNYCEKNKEKLKLKKQKYNEKNIDKIKERNHQWYLKNKEKCDLNNKINREKNKEKYKEKKKEYYIKNKEKIKEYQNKWNKEKMKNDINYKLRRILSMRLRDALRSKSPKNCSIIDLLGVSIEDFKWCMEYQFEPGMTWDNYETEWEIDHVIPLSLVDLSNEVLRKTVFHVTNCQPLWKKDNRIKGNRLIQKYFYKEHLMKKEVA